MMKSTSFRDSAGKGVVDVLFGGKQTVTPDTVHPDIDRPYVWIGSTLFDCPPECPLQNLPEITPLKLGLLRLVVGSEHARVLTTGVTTHDAGIRLVAHLVLEGYDDETITAIIRALLPKNYSGNSLEELPGWIESARDKGFSSVKAKKALDEVTALIVAEQMNPLVYVHGDGFLRYTKGVWTSISERDVDRAAKALLMPLMKGGLVAGMLNSVRRCLLLNIEREQFGLFSQKICLENGTLDLVTGELEAHSPEHELRFKLSFEYDPNAACPTYEDQLNWTFAGNAEAMALFEEFAALTLVPDMRFQKALYLIGEGGSGKSTLLRILEAMHDPAAISVTPLDKIDEERYLTDLARKLACLSFDVQRAKKVFGEAFVRITGGDPVTIRRLYQEVQGKVTPTVRFIGSMNPDMPPYIGAPDALRRRLIFLECGSRVANPDPDRDIKLKAELPGILLRWVAALKRLRERGRFAIPEGSVAFLEDYLHAADPFDIFFEETLERDDTAKMPVGDVQKAFNGWADDHGEARLAVAIVGRKLRRLQIKGTYARSGKGPDSHTVRTVGVKFRKRFQFQ